MKNALLLTLAFLAIQPAFAQRMEREPREPGQPSAPIGRMDLTMCLKTLAHTETTIRDLQSQLEQSNRYNRECRDRRDDRRDSPEVEGLRRDVQRLTQDNARLSFDNSNMAAQITNLQIENNELRRMLENTRPPRQIEYFSYSGCTDFSGRVDLRYISAGTGFFPIESEVNAIANLKMERNCNYSAVNVATEEIQTSEKMNYCTAGCTDFSGKIDNKTVVGERGRNRTEAAYLALKKAQAQNCNYSVQVQNCQ